MVIFTSDLVQAQARIIVYVLFVNTGLHKFAVYCILFLIFYLTVVNVHKNLVNMKADRLVEELRNTYVVPRHTVSGIDIGTGIIDHRQDLGDTIIPEGRIHLHRSVNVLYFIFNHIDRKYHKNIHIPYLSLKKTQTFYPLHC